MDIEDIQDRIRRLQEAAQGVEGSAVSPDHAIAIRVAVGGKVKAIDLNHRAFSMSGNELGALIVRTFNQARGDANQQMAALQAQVMGVEAPIASGKPHVDLKDIRQRLGKENS